MIQLPTLTINSTSSSTSRSSSQINSPVAVAQVSLPQISQIIILHTIDLDQDDLETLGSYGVVVAYDINVEGSLPISSLNFSYLLLDLRNKPDRTYYDSQDTSPFQIIGFISVIEEFDDLIDKLGCSNVITSFPQKQHFQIDYNKLLLTTATKSPTKCFSFVNYISNFLGSLKKK